MSFQWKLLILLALYLEDQVHGGRIFGGHEAVPHSRPYMVLLEMSMKDGTTEHCGGFLLSEDFVMTAAHCQAESYTVFLGLHNYHERKDAQTLCVEEAFPHKNYNSATLINDIMLLKLKSKANFNKNVTPIAIADQDNGSLPKSCIVSGWGAKSNKVNDYMSSKLMEVNVKLIDDAYCTNKDVYCAEGEIGPEKGDSGGPLVCEDGKAYGVVSMKNTQTNGRVLKLYTKIPEKKSWISLAMEKHP